MTKQTPNVKWKIIIIPTLALLLGCAASRPLFPEPAAPSHPIMLAPTAQEAEPARLSPTPRTIRVGDWSVTCSSIGQTTGAILAEWAHPPIPVIADYKSVVRVEVIVINRGDRPAPPPDFIMVYQRRRYWADAQNSYGDRCQPWDFINPDDARHYCFYYCADGADGLMIVQDASNAGVIYFRPSASPGVPRDPASPLSRSGR